MRFCDFFINYKIGLKEIKSTIPFTKLPLYRKIAAISLFASAMISGILAIFNFIAAAYIVLTLGGISFIIFLIIDSRKKNLEIMLKDHYTPHSQEKMEMVIDLLQQYDLDIHDVKTIDLLIEEAQNAKIQSDYLAPLKKPIKILGTIIIPLVAAVVEKISDTASQDDMIIFAAEVIVIVLMIFSIIFALSPLVKHILYRDYNKYDDLIYDLRQIKLFYAKQD